jgi:signal transduction histidine kinase
LFSVFVALDISHEKRRQALEHIFLHDIHNVACGLSWCIDFLQKATPDEREQHLDDIRRLCRELNEEIGAQRTLLRAESGELVLTPAKVGSLGLLQDAVDLYRGHPVAQGRILRVDDQARDATVVSDRILLLRVVCNLIKNALEASQAGHTVTAGCAADGNVAEFWVHNEGFMPRDVQLQVFQRSFSTKGIGRGLGTYSVRLLTERYLKGSVSFTTSPGQGTTFRIRCPLILE